MMTFFSLSLLGFVLGMRHATDADHVVAVTTIVSRQRTVRHAAMIGMVWGIGHTLTLLLAGSAIVFFGLVIPPRLGMSLEFSVALMLVLLGLCHLAVFAPWFGLQPEKEDGRQRARREEWARTQNGWFCFPQSFRPLIVGVVHGLAGSAALALLLLPLIQQPAWAMAYLLVFGVGTIAGMMLITAVIALPFTCSARWSAAFHRRLGLAASCLSVALGLFLAYQIAFVDGLFGR